jgi:SAM-dependent methyltransferase
MGLTIKSSRQFARRTANFFQSVLLSFPKKVQCNICGWEGRHFLSDSWHKYINCPQCRSGIRHRLFFAALQNIEQLSLNKLFLDKTVLHFAPEDIISSKIKNKPTRYVTADYYRQDCDLKLDMSDMPEVAKENFDVVIAFDVLEHVPDYQKALEEVHRILSVNGFGIFTVPQKDNLQETFEDPSIVTPEDREKHFGQSDHLRIFGDDFCGTVESKGFSVTAVSESMFYENIRRKHVLFPLVLSKNPLATNYRKVFFCQKLF